jgi:hypothetical protein
MTKGNQFNGIHPATAIVHTLIREIPMQPPEDKKIIGPAPIYSDVHKTMKQNTKSKCESRTKPKTCFSYCTVDIPTEKCEPGVSC